MATTTTTTTVTVEQSPTGEKLYRPTRAKKDKYIRIASQKVIPRVFLIVMCALFLLPFYWMIATALKGNTELAAYPPTLVPQAPDWGNFRASTEVFPFWRYAGNTAIITFFSVLGAVISNTIVAYGFSRIEWPGRDKVFFLVLATVFVPSPVLIIALFDIMAKLNWIDTYLPLIVPMWFGNAFWIFLVRQFFLQIPKDISDAARLDGANEFQIFGQIILPLAKSAAGVVAIFATVHAWNDFLGPLIYLQSSDNYTLSIGLTFFQQANARDIQYNLLMAASTLIVLPVIALFLSFQSTFTEGISVAGLKG
jgi:multiple sugar transport system permease protein